MASRRNFLLAGAGAPLSLGAAGAVGASAVTAEVRPHNGRAELFVNGKPVYPAFFALTDAPGGRWSWEEIPQAAMRDFAAAGFRLFQVDLFLESVWTKPGPLDLALARRQLAGVLEACPEAAIVVRWHLNAPRWWVAAHPEECTRYANGGFEAIDRTQPVRILMDDLRRVPRASLASAGWRRMATEKTVELLQGLAAAPEGRALAGIHPACGVYGEWHYWGFMRNEPDTGPAMQGHFDAWRNERGKAPARVPSVEERAGLDDGIFRDPARRDAVIDYYKAQQELVADLILHFCGTARRHWPRRLLTGVFYGYFFSMFDRPATGGHLCLQKVLASPDVDYLSAPQAYGDPYRALGAAGITRGLVESARLNGKLFLDEMDQTPSWQWQNNVDTAFRLTDLDSDVAILRRNVVTSYTRGAGLWYYDFGPANTAGWWMDSRLMDEARRIHALLGRYHQRPYEPAADVLFVFDTDVFYYTGSIQRSDPLTDVKAVNATIVAAWPAGAALETIHLGDLGKADLNRFRVVVFANTWLLTAPQRRFIREKVMSPSRHVVFQGAPGYCDGRKLSLDFVRESTGLDVRRVEGSAWTPQFAVAGEPAGAVRRGNTWFATVPPADPAAWREIFRAAGAHLYVETGDIIHAGGGLVLLHTKSGGARELKLRGGRAVQVQMPPKSSWVFDAQSGAKLLG
jgi:hypothetical protein